MGGQGGDGAEGNAEGEGEVRRVMVIFAMNASMKSDAVTKTIKYHA